MAACALAVGLAVIVWAGATTFKPFSHGGNPARHLAVLAILIAVYGMIMASLGRRLSAATPGFLRILQTTTTKPNCSPATAASRSGTGSSAKPSCRP
jgi:hypothetical protein